MKKILHIACLLNPAKGIQRQMQMENESSKILNIPFDSKIFVTTDYFKENDIFIDSKVQGNTLKSYILLRVKFIFWIIQNQKKYDLILLRYSMHDPFQWILSFFLRKYLTVHHTFEIEEAGLNGGLKGKIKKLIEKLFSGRVLNNTLGIVGVTNEIIKYEIARLKIEKNRKTFLYTNGIRCDSVVKDNRKKELEGVFVASLFSPWIGLDLLIEEFKKKPQNIDSIKIHLVGQIPNSLLDEVNKIDNFIVHGSLEYNDLQSLMQECSFGITSFAFYRKNMYEACTLKTREYLCQGLPVIGGYKEAGFDESFPYYKQIECDLEKIIEFGNLHKSTSREQIKKESLNYIDKTNILHNLYNGIKEL
jgi:glycosyltransferase involved in cell wall biosynthesis